MTKMTEQKMDDFLQKNNRNCPQNEISRPAKTLVLEISKIVYAFNLMLKMCTFHISQLCRDRIENYIASPAII